MDSVTGRTVCSELFSLSSSFCICSVGFSRRQNLFRFNRCQKRGDRAPHLSCISAASRITRPLPRGFTGHVALPNLSILSSRGEAERKVRLEAGSKEQQRTAAYVETTASQGGQRTRHAGKAPGRWSDRRGQAVNEREQVNQQKSEIRGHKSG